MENKKKGLTGWLFCLLLAGFLVMGSGSVRAKMTVPMPCQETETEEMEESSIKGEAYVEGEVLVLRRGAADPCAYEKICSKTETTKELLARIRKQEDVILAQPNYIYRLASADEFFPYQYALDNVGQMGGVYGMDTAPESVSPVSKKEVVVAVVDSGVDYTHEDLADRMWRNPYYNNLAGTYGVDPGNGDEDPMDDMGHGTHVAGIIAAECDNGLGISGIAGGANVKIMAVKAFDVTGNATTESLIKGYSYIYEAAKLGVNVRVVNNSFTGNYNDNMTQRMVELLGEKGILVVVSAGNQGQDLDVHASYPTLCDCPNLVNVAASDQRGNLAGYSNYGSQSVDLAAPGNHILSTVPYAAAVFLPSLYSDVQKGKLQTADPSQVWCAQYQDFADLSKVDWIATSVQGSAGRSEARPSATECFGVGDPYSLEWKITGAKQKDYYMLMFPYTKGDDVELVYENVACMIKNKADYADSKTELALYHAFLNADDSINYSRKIQKLGSVPAGEVEDYFHFLPVVATVSAVEGDRCAFIFQLEVEEDTEEVCIYLDDFGISRGTLPKEAFLPYDFFSGTSMSAPFVSGALAKLAAAYPEKKGLELKELLFSCVKQTPSLQNKVRTGGYLKLSNLGKMPYMEDISLSQDGVLTIKGGGFQKSGMTVEINGAPFKYQFQDKQEIRIKNALSYSRKRIRISLKNDYGYQTERMQYVSAEKKPERIQSMESDYAIGESRMAVGTDAYYILFQDGRLSICGKGGVEETVSMAGKRHFKENPEYHLPNYSLTPVSQPVCIGDRLYVVLDAATEYTQDIFLAVYDGKEGRWSKEAELPEEYRQMALTDFTLAAYQGRLYFLGGLDEKKGLSAAVVSYDVEKRRFEELDALPARMCKAAAVEAGGRLYVFGGVVEQAPVLYSFRNGKWREEDLDVSLLCCLEPVQFLLSSGMVEQYQNYPVSLCAAKGRLYFAGNPADGYGDIFYYDLKKKKLKKTGYSLQGASLQYQYTDAVALKGAVYLLTSNYIEDAEKPAYAHVVLKEAVYRIRAAGKK